MGNFWIRPGGTQDRYLRHFDCKNATFYHWVGITVPAKDKDKALDMFEWELVEPKRPPQGWRPAGSVYTYRRKDGQTQHVLAYVMPTGPLPAGVTGVELHLKHKESGAYLARDRHTVRLPKYLEHRRRWNHPLVKHEFDHVAISCDPRLKMLVVHLLQNIGRIDTTVNSTATLDTRFVRELIDQEIAKRVDAAVELLNANQQQLDEVTRHGAAPIPDREAFFRSLFTKPNFDRVKFPYTGEVLDLLESDAYRKATLPYAFDG